MKAITTALIIAAIIITGLACSAAYAFLTQQATARAQAAARQAEAQVAAIAASGQAEIDRAVAESVRTANAAARADTAAVHPAPPATIPAWAMDSAAGMLAAAAVFVAWNARRRRHPDPQQAAQLAAAVYAEMTAMYQAEIAAGRLRVFPIQEQISEVAPRPAEQPAEIVLF